MTARTRASACPRLVFFLRGLPAQGQPLQGRQAHGKDNTCSHGMTGTSLNGSRFALSYHSSFHVGVVLEVTISSTKVKKLKEGEGGRKRKSVQGEEYDERGLVKVLITTVQAEALG